MHTAVHSAVQTAVHTAVHTVVHAAVHMAVHADVHTSMVNMQSVAPSPYSHAWCEPSLSRTPPAVTFHIQPIAVTGVTDGSITGPAEILLM